MRLLNLRAFKFGPLMDVSFSFPDDPGLFYVTGRNEVQPRLGTNAVGKSYLWAAVTWVIFDRTPKKLYASNISPWTDPGGTWVEIDYTTDELNVVTIRRSWKPNGWTLSMIGPGGDHSVDLTKDDGNLVLADVKLSFDMWIRAVVNPQQEPMFMDQKPEAKAKLLTEALGLDIWLDRATRANKKADDLSPAILQAEKEESRLQGALDSAPSNLTDLAGEWEQSRERQLVTLERRHGELQGAHAAAKIQLNRAQERATKLQEQVAAKHQLLADRIDPALLDLNRAIQKGDRELDREEAKGAAVMDAIKQLETMSECDVCGQSITDLVLAHRTHSLRGILTDVDVARDAIVADLRELEGLKEELTKERRAVEMELDDLRRDYHEADAQVSNARREAALLDKDLDRIEDEAQDLEEAQNPHAAALEKETTARRRDLDRLDAVRSELIRLYEEQGLLRNWSRWFKEIRLELLDEAMTQLEIEVNSSLAELGLPDWEVQFASDRETAKGALTKGFTVGVISPVTPKPVPWEVWSGGEAQRLRLAGEMGLRDLIRARTGATINLEVWDEPTEGMSPSGVTDLLECLRRRSAREGLQVWLVDHHVMGASSFDGVLFIRRDAEGSHLEWKTA